MWKLFHVDEERFFMEKRQQFGSRLGFILLSAGCAIGLGNVYRFPMKVGQYGGGAFVLVYILCLIFLGLPVMVMEFSMGRAAQASPVKLYQSITPKKKVWPVHGYLCLVANILLMSFYTTIAGWIGYYGVKSAKGDFSAIPADKDAAADFVNGQFGALLSNNKLMILCTAVVAILACLICSFGLQKGLERITKYMMLALLLLMGALAIYGMTLSGAKEGLEFYLKPDLSKMLIETENGKRFNWTVVSEAMNQAFFTLSLGIGSMAIFGSYLGKERSLTGETINIILLDTLVAIVAGLIIFPACMTYDVETTEGARLLFLTLPRVFNGIPGGQLWCTLFFVFMTFAAFSTVLAVYENIIACVSELTHISRRWTSLIVCVFMILMNIPFILGNNIWSGFHPFGLPGKDISDLEDFFVSTLMLPLGSLTYVIYCTQNFGWGWKNFIAEANTGKGLKFPAKIKLYASFVLPAIILVIFVLGLIAYFKH